MFEIIQSLKPYFFSLREIESNISLDLKIPTSWKYETIITPYRSIKYKIQDKNDKFNLISLISIASKEGYDVVIGCANEIILVNKEEEEKKRLFEEKVNELKILFQNQTLDKLKDIKLIEENGQEDSTGFGMVEQGNREGQFGDIETQGDDN
jgi:hypothetical protein